MSEVLAEITSRKSGNVCQQVRTLHAPLTPWHLHWCLIILWTACTRNQIKSNPLFMNCCYFSNFKLNVNIHHLNLPCDRHGCCADSWGPVNLAVCAHGRRWIDARSCFRTERFRNSHPKRIRLARRYVCPVYPTHNKKALNIWLLHKWRKFHKFHLLNKFNGTVLHWVELNNLPLGIATFVNKFPSAELNYLLNC